MNHKPTRNRWWTLDEITDALSQILNYHTINIVQFKVFQTQGASFFNAVLLPTHFAQSSILVPNQNRNLSFQFFTNQTSMTSFSQIRLVSKSELPFPCMQQFGITIKTLMLNGTLGSDIWLDPEVNSFLRFDYRDIDLG